MSRLLLPLVALLGLTACGDDPDRTYSGVASAAHDCGSREKKVAVNGNGGTFTFTGTCESIAINGNDMKVTVAATKAAVVNGTKNTVMIDAADHIRANGADNTVTWRKGLPGVAPSSAAGKGNNNSIEQAK